VATRSRSGEGQQAKERPQIFVRSSTTLCPPQSSYTVWMLRSRRLPGCADNYARYEGLVVQMASMLSIATSSPSLAVINPGARSDRDSRDLVCVCRR
jgi:hypothetical protein